MQPQRLPTRPHLLSLLNPVASRSWRTQPAPQPTPQSPETKPKSAQILSSPATVDSLCDSCPRHHRPASFCVLQPPHSRDTRPHICVRSSTSPAPPDPLGFHCMTSTCLSRSVINAGPEPHQHLEPPRCTSQSNTSSTSSPTPQLASATSARQSTCSAASPLT